MTSFSYAANPVRVVFGALDGLGAEADRLGLGRVLLIGRPRHGDRAAEALGPRLAARFEEPAMHTPVDVTERALKLVAEHDVDGVVAIGGGSATGLSKAIALHTDLPQLIVPTTYAGSELTSVLGQTADGRKTTQKTPKVRPETVLYDVGLTLGLPVGVSAASGLNALAHAVEARYAPDANPMTDLLAAEATKSLMSALPRIAADPSDVDARADALRGAWLAGSCLDAVKMGLHHRLCHHLGGKFGLPHAETHAVLLPHVMAHQGLDDADDVFELAASLPIPHSLAELGLTEADIQGEPEEELLRQALHGTRPAARPSLKALTKQVVDSFAGAPDRARTLLTDLVETLHDYAIRTDLTQEEWEYAIGFLTRAGHITTDTRQEFILLSDTLGVSSVVDVLTNSRTPDTTPSAVLGPFYVEGPPETPQGADIADGLPGTPLWTDIQVTDTEDHPVPEAIVDVWQSNEDGFYDVQLPEVDGPVLRARFRTDADGRLRFRTIVPSAYPIPADGPVGEMLNAVGRHPYRAPHVHFMIAKPGYRTLITQLFVAGGDYLDSDTVFGVKDGLIVDFTDQRLEFTFRIQGSTE
ncbi:maleylacetate reductase and hydroxyquinol 1,2-dioxygenase domain-containing protein [Amycolatopsis sp. SID8362]|uniref:maleylacetate reductase and hydroxyquinol 1,2-dioxygenase domain-containing protein n=1 Tax=Amycolatopsis sp. SID8362 TaxID=2690346 RepID=UPI0013714AFD|nr:maleylacetate reductase and hydroxyquinol 1,2-dioxygenase domain-containing protein [Amycolatopsis sp. SID8362]NBH06694.1 iron-containing alcohol dehydrogenase [Amycolatopsis sp. SID8362]NED43391.1 iron-containing alcohol dehydrogenase [Amycolatopsis sp. SID8362]